METASTPSTKKSCVHCSAHPFALILFFFFTVLISHAQRLNPEFPYNGKMWWTVEHDEFVDEIFKLNDIRLKKVKTWYDAAVANKDFKINKNGTSALHTAVAISDLETVKMFLNLGADPNMIISCVPKYPKAVRGFTPLMMLSWYRGNAKYADSINTYPKQDAEIAQLLISAGADVNKTTWASSSDQSALRFVVRNSDNFPVIKVLLEAGADPNSGEKNATTIGYSKSLKTYKLLLEFGAKPPVWTLYNNDFEDPEILDFTGITAKRETELAKYDNIKFKGVGNTSSSSSVGSDGKLEPGKYLYIEQSQPVLALGIEVVTYIDFKEVETVERLSRNDIINNSVRPKNFRRATFAVGSQKLTPCGTSCDTLIAEEKARWNNQKTVFNSH